jgi:hypothetical protein
VRSLEKPVCFKIEPMGHTRLREMDQQGHGRGADHPGFPEVSLPRYVWRVARIARVQFSMNCLLCDRPERSPLHDVRKPALRLSDDKSKAKLFSLRTSIKALHRSGDHRWWSQTGSNRRPPACKAGALPTELWPRLAVNILYKPEDWWAWEDLNFRPHAYQARALTN